MHIGTRDTGPGQLTVAPTGEIDMASAARLDQTLDEVLRRAGVVEIVVDLTDVPYLDSTGVGSLLRGAAEAVGRGATLRVTNARPVVARVLRITAVDGLLGLTDGDGRSTVQPGWRRLS
ncbi:STAS domain-containing protein [Micromonospora mangrovi]|uniref:Anti-sigma factor antagonist n=2 Tax=Micromonospora TaxID=1873 RepID=A0AAU8H9E9_9ACTN